MKKLFLDDTKSVEQVYGPSQVDKFDRVRSFEEFTAYIEKFGLPDFISFDHDLASSASGKSGYDCALWLIEDSGEDLLNLQFKIHSDSGEHADKIRNLLDDYMRRLNEEEE